MTDRLDTSSLPLGWEPRVLVADDDSVSRVAAKWLLQRVGLVADIACDGREALQMAAEWPYVAIFLDCFMPELDGYQTVREIRSRLGAQQRPLVVAMTGQHRDASMAAGMDHHIDKPLRLGQLQADCANLGLLLRACPPAEAIDAQTPLIGADRFGAAAFADHARFRLPELWRAANLRDNETLRRVALDLQERAAVAGATRVADLCRRLADAVQRGDGDAAAALEPIVRQALAETAAAAADPSADVDAPVTAAASAVRVAIADDDPLARLAIESLIQRGDGLELVGSAGGVAEIVRLVGATRPDVAVVDFMMPDGGGPEAARQIRARCPDTQVIGLTASDNHGDYAEMLRAGAAGLLLKGTSLDEIVQTIRRAAERLSA
ncbi:MAG TPA: response regulator [Solirubrobacteraceae bacterium]|jgi:CheY-like chemotaxis protein|nr:response regulator [Solirubrobacteraceae bacterium]